MLNAVENNGCSIAHADEELQNDMEVVLAAIQQDGSALVFAGEKAQANKDVVMKALQNGGSLFGVAPSLLDDKELLLEAIKLNCWALDDIEVSEEMRNDRDIVNAIKEGIARSRTRSP